MPPADPANWTEQLRRTLAAYETALLRQVAANLCRPRNQWPADEFVERCVQAVDNPAVLDRRLKDVSDAGRRVLALIAHSRQPRWQVGHLVELSVALGEADGLEPVRNLLEAGLLFPDLHARAGPRGSKAGGRLKSFAQWLSAEAVPGVFAHPAISARALGSDLGLPTCPGTVVVPDPTAVHEADGLEWLLRLAALWQQVKVGPLRRTQQHDFFKRDLDRLRADVILSGPPADTLGEIPDTALFTVALAGAHGVVDEENGELKAAAGFPEEWHAGLWPALASLWAALPRLEGWSPAQGWHAGSASGNPYPSANLLALLLLTRLPDNAWASPEAIEEWVTRHHPFWAQNRALVERSTGKNGNRAASAAIGVAAFLRGIAFPLRLLQAVKDSDGRALVRLSPAGRWILGLGDLPPAPTAFPQTLLVQPNLEILAYRQGLWPELIVRLTRLAAWRNLGAACTLQLQPETVYRALEAGETFETLLQTLERNGQKATPPAVVQALRTWANKRERLTVYPAAALLEFATPADLHEALSRGMNAVRLTDRLAVVANEDEIDYRQFRLTGTRDYTALPERCVEVDGDGVTLSVDVVKADLLLETELQRFAEPVARASANGRRLYRLTPATLSAGRVAGLNLSTLETWFDKRVGQPLSPAARLLLTAPELSPPEVQSHLVMHVADRDFADGLCQWPTTRALIHDRLGPTALSVQEKNLPKLLEELRTLGISPQRQENDIGPPPQ